MVKFGDFVTYNDLVYKVVGISEDETPTLTLEPARRKTESITKTITTGRKTHSLVPSGGSRLASIATDNVTVLGFGTAVVRSLADGIVRVSFDSNGGSAVDYQDIESGGLVTEPDDPTLEGFIFDAWYYDDTTFANAVDFAKDTFDDETVLYANWTEDI